MILDAQFQIMVVWKMGKTRRISSEHSTDCPRPPGVFHTEGIGWEQFTDAVIQTLNDQDRPIVYLLWGRPAR